MENLINSLIFKIAANKASTTHPGSVEIIANEIKSEIREKCKIKPKGLTLILTNKKQPDLLVALKIKDVLNRYDASITLDAMVVNRVATIARKHGLRKSA